MLSSKCQTSYFFKETNMCFYKICYFDLIPYKTHSLRRVLPVGCVSKIEVSFLKKDFL